jgi:hypothetical protein
MNCKCERNTVSCKPFCLFHHAPPFFLYTFSKLFEGGFMLRVKVLAFLVLAAFLAFSCSKDSSDDNNNSTPTGGGNNTTGGNSNLGSLATHSGANTVVTESNVNAVSTQIMQIATAAFAKAQTKASYAAKPAIDINLAGDVSGDKSGKLTVNGKYTMSADQKSINYNFNTTFYDYSDDNGLFLGGAIVYTGTYNLTTNAYDLTYTGGLKFNGTYSGVQDFVTKYKLTGTTSTSFTYTSTTNTTSGGKSFTSTITYPQ